MMGVVILTNNYKKHLSTKNETMGLKCNEYRHLHAVNGPFMGWILLNQHEMSFGIFFFKFDIILEKYTGELNFGDESDIFVDLSPFCAFIGQMMVKNALK